MARHNTATNYFLKKELLTLKLLTRIHIIQNQHAATQVQDGVNIKFNKQTYV